MRSYGRLYVKSIIDAEPVYTDCETAEKELELNEGSYTIIPICRETRIEILRSELKS
jgi:Zn finger protein HypA/HybF involved in hydrogenase expression